MQHPTITAVIVSYRSRPCIDGALNALGRAFESALVECVVVDNARDDGSADYVASNHPWVTLIRSPENLGFGRGNNLGFGHCRTPYLLVLNPDAVIDEVALRTLAAFMDRTPRAAIVAPAIVEGRSSLQAAGMMTTPRTLLAAALGTPDPYPDRRVIEPNSPPFLTPWVCGAIMLIRAETFRSLGGFDPRFFLYFEETDLCRRATAAGFQIWANGEAVAEHVGGASARSACPALTHSCIPKFYNKSRRAYLRKHFGTIPAVATECLVAIGSMARPIRTALRPRSSESMRDRAEMLTTDSQNK